MPFDLKTLTVRGEPVGVVEGVRRAAPGTTGAVHFAVSDSGTLAYLSGSPGPGGPAVQAALFDRNGSAEPLSIPLGVYRAPRVSPDGSRLLLNVDDGKESQVWVYGFSRSSAARRLTFGGSNKFAAWSADSARVVFQSTREGDAALWWQRADGTDSATRLTRAAAGVAHVPQSWSPDGKVLLFDEVKDGRVTLWQYFAGSGQSSVLLTLDSDVPTGATFSPDGKWIAYTARERAALAAVYVQPSPTTGARYLVSKDSDDGHHPVWSPDGREIIYTPGPGNLLTSVAVGTTPSITFGDPVAVPRYFVNTPPDDERTYDIMRDGKRFLGLRTDIGRDGRLQRPEIQVVWNWLQELDARVPVK
jgi:serine/threonine-protein kinase